MKKLVLRFREQEFNNAVKEYGNRTRLEAVIKAELKQLLPKTKIDNSFLKGGIELNFYNAIEKAYPKYKELSIKATKIPELLDMDISKLMKLISEYEQGPISVVSPSITQYEDLAESQEEIDKYEAVEKVIQAVYEAEKVLGIEVYKGNISQAFKGWVGAQMGSQKLWFNAQLVFNERRHTHKKKELVL